LQDSKKQTGIKPRINPYLAFILSIPLPDFSVLKIENGTSTVLYSIMLVFHDYPTAVYFASFGSRNLYG
jgi:hypothetical protein